MAMVDAKWKQGERPWDQKIAGAFFSTSVAQPSQILHCKIKL